MLPPKKELNLNKITFNKQTQKIALTTKFNFTKQQQQNEQRPISSKIDSSPVSITWLIDNIQMENKLEWVSKCYNYFKDWTQTTEKNDQNQEMILKQAVLLIEYNDLQVRLFAIKATLLGFMTLNLLELLFQKQVKLPLRRPKSGSSKQLEQQLPSLLYQPQQFLAILQKASNLSNENIFVKLLNDNPLHLVLFRLLKLFSQLQKDLNTSIQLLQYLNPLLVIIKNTANNQREASKFLSQQFLSYLDAIFHTFPQDISIEKELIALNISITATLRNLSNEQMSAELFLTNGIINKLVFTMANYSGCYELILNTLRIMSKLSLSKHCCDLFLKNTQAMQNISNFFQIYQKNIYIIIRASYLLANMTTYFEGIRQLIYFQFNSFPDILKCFEYYWTKEINPAELNQIEQFSQSKAAWDFQILKEEKDVDALIRIIRLIANLLTIEQIGQDILKNYSQEFRQLVQKLLKLLQKNNQINKQAELISCSLSCLSNLTFYDKQAFLNDFEYKNVKYDLIGILGHFIIQNEDQEICCDGLRVLSNLSRQKELIKQIMKSRVSEGVIVLLDSNSREVVYYSLGVILNLLQDLTFKNKEYTNIIDQILQVLQDCTTNENDIANIGLKCLVLLLDQNLNSEYTEKIEQAVQNFGNVCDKVLMEKANKALNNTRQLINQIINNIPEEGYACLQPNCGRKFKSQMELQDHINRRHKL